MTLTYQGKDITDAVTIKACVCTDGCGDKMDSSEITFEHSGDWYLWQPQIGDEVILSDGNYTTGTQYVTAMLPENNTFTLLTTALPLKAHGKKWQSFEGKTLGSIMDQLSAECGMGWKLYGLSKDTRIGYITRNDEHAAAFLQRLLTMEGAVLKCYNGTMIGIGVVYAQGLTATQTMELTVDQESVQYIRNAGQELKSMTVYAPGIEVTATDKDALTAESRRKALPALGKEEAGRWARGLLLNNNRRMEELHLDVSYNSGWTAMGRININGPAMTAGKWLIDRVEHDLIERTSTAVLVRSREGIA